MPRWTLRNVLVAILWEGWYASAWFGTLLTGWVWGGQMGFAEFWISLGMALLREPDAPHCIREIADLRDRG